MAIRAMMKMILENRIEVDRAGIRLGKMFLVKERRAETWKGGEREAYDLLGKNIPQREQPVQRHAGDTVKKPRILGFTLNRL